MLVDFIGDVIELNSEKVFIHKDGKVIGRKSTKEIVEAIHDKAIQNHVFYNRMYTEISSQYTAKKKEVDRLIKEEQACAWSVAINRKSAQFGGVPRDLNKELDYEDKKKAYLKASYELSGIHDVCRYAFEKLEEAEKIQKQASTVMRQLY